LYRDATQTVFGEGPRQAQVMLVGEQPGDREDVQGAPFVGPAGKLLDRALAEAGVDRERTYLTNAVKHFKFTRAERGKHRIHKKPSRGEIVACRPWLLAECDAVRPRLAVLLGATAASSMMGPSFRVTQHRGTLVDAPEEFAGHPELVLPTVHPSSVLRAPDRESAYSAFVADLRAAAG
jgi:uracil-DNA glycosylase family protein